MGRRSGYGRSLDQCSIEFMTSNLGFQSEQTENMSNDVIPGLNR
jgi:hypothetical protein